MYLLVCVCFRSWTGLFRSVWDWNTFTTGRSCTETSKLRYVSQTCVETTLICLSLTRNRLIVSTVVSRTSSSLKEDWRSSWETLASPECWTGECECVYLCVCGLFWCCSVVCVEQHHGAGQNLRGDAVLSVSRDLWEQTLQQQNVRPSALHRTAAGLSQITRKCSKNVMH